MGPDLQLPLVADRNMKISRDYGVLIEEEGITLRGLFLIDPQGILRFDCCVCLFWLRWVTNLQTSRQITVNDLPVGRSVEETIRLIKAFQFSVRPLPLTFHVFMLSDDIVVISASSFLSTLSHYCLIFLVPLRAVSDMPSLVYRTNMGKSVLQTGPRAQRR